MLLGFAEGESLLTNELRDPVKYRNGWDGDVGLAQAFESQRPRLLRVAYAMTGSFVEAEDCVQEAWLRLQRMNDPSSIVDLPAWLTKTVSRLALDALDRARVKRERYVGTWLPEPIVEEVEDDPAERAVLDESVSMALLVVLESLTPAERTAFLLHDVFNLSFNEIAAVVGRTPEAVRKLASRARQHIERGRPRSSRRPTPSRKRLVAAFAIACQQGDLGHLLSVLDPDVVWRSDSGGKVVSIREVQRGALTVARGLIAFGRQQLGPVRIARVNGAPGLVLRDALGVLTVVAFTVQEGRITAIDVVRNPDKLAAVHIRDGI